MTLLKVHTSCCLLHRRTHVPTSRICKMAVAFSSCCRWFGLRLYRSGSIMSPTVQLSSLSSTGKLSLLIARLPSRCPRVCYYVKPKERKGPSLKGWFIFGAGCFGLTAGAVVYMGMKRKFF